jgi:RND family efflux transporter MFP subunit
MKKLVGLCAIGASILVAVFLTSIKEVPAKKQTAQAPMNVAVVNIWPQKVQDIITGHATVRARWETNLTAEVAGRVLRVSYLLLQGESFKTGDELAVIEDSTYRSAFASAKSKLATAMRQYREEQERALVAKENWLVSGIQGEASELTLRTPQLTEFKAAVDAAVAEAEKAKYDLGQTKILAPYDGVVVDRSINPGDTLQVGTALAKVYDRKVFDVAIALNAKQFSRLAKNPIGSSVQLFAGDSKENWLGHIIRVDQSIDSENRWRNVHVEVTETDGLLPGQFVTALIPGKIYSDAFAVPESLISSDGTVWFVDKDNKLQNLMGNILFYANDNAVLAIPENFQPPLSATANRDIYLPGTRVNQVITKNVPSLYFSLVSGEHQ